MRRDATTQLSTLRTRDVESKLAVRINKGSDWSTGGVRHDSTAVLKDASHLQCSRSSSSVPVFDLYLITGLQTQFSALTSQYNILQLQHFSFV